LGADTLHFKKAEELLLRMNPDIVNKIGSAELKTLMRSKLEQVGSDSSPEIKELFDFEQFASLLCDVIKLQRDYERDHRDTQFLSGFREHFPIEPESTPKQLWDILCMIILLYCSFSVPLSIAFPATTETGITTVQDQVELSFDIIFMLDIGLSFLTAYDNQGITVRDFRAIAANYLRTWFLLDFAGSFPFDVVFAETFAGSANFLQAMRAIRAVRLLKLVRTIKFMNKLNQLKSREGYESFGPLISLFSSIFLLIFVAHLLGCAYTYMLNYEPDLNWLLAYDPTLSNADWSARYITGACIVWLSVQVSPYCPHCSAVPGPSSSARHWCGICLEASGTVRVCAHRAARGIQSG